MLDTVFATIPTIFDKGFKKLATSLNNGNIAFSISIITGNKSNSISSPINLKFKWNESGSSGGFMLSLAIYDRLVDADLTKGRKIVGTGTIDANGNVGEIGGVKYKVLGASREKADIFFCPKENYEEAINTKNKYNLKLKIVKVETLEEAINYLKNN